MSTDGQGRYDRSRYGSRGQSNESSNESPYRYKDGFYEDMRIPQDQSNQSFSERLAASQNEHARTRRSAEATSASRSGRMPAIEPRRTGSASSTGAISERARYQNASDSRARQTRSRNAVTDDSRQVLQSDASRVSSSSQSRRQAGSTERQVAASQARQSRTQNQTDATGDNPYSRYSRDTDASGRRTYSLRDDDQQPATSRSYSRRSVEHELAANSHKRQRAPWFRAALIALIAVVVIGAGAAFAYVSGIANNLHAGVDQNLRDALVQTDMANEAFYMVLLGTDASAVREEIDGEGAQYRTDSMMLARIDAPNKKATLISIPRDIEVDLGSNGKQKINAAYSIGGAAYAVETISKLAGVPISHYAEVNFDGFKAMVDALGGIEVDVPMSFDDEDAEGALDAGLQTLNGEQALVLCRVRNAYADVAAKPDAMRAANQRLVLSAIAKTLLASDIPTIASTVSAMSKYVTTDLELNDIIGLAQAMRGINTDTDIYTAAVPTTSQYIDEIWYEFVNKSEWDTMMKRVKEGLPPTEESEIDEATGTVMATAGSAATMSGEKYATVTVKNGTNTEGLATSVRSKLMEDGFKNVVIGDVASGYDYPDTLILYDEPAREREAQEILRVIGQGETMLNDGSYLMTDCDLLVVIGDDWQK